jgi:hypothetical protein
MIRPVNFIFNEETAVNNAFQVKSNQANTQQEALKEFDDFVSILRSNGVDVTVVNDTPSPHTPDSIFPNNWVSFHKDGSVMLYPMFAENRRAERKQHVLDAVREKFAVKEEVDLTSFEKESHFLEGTGSMVLDREFKMAYACISPRTSEKVLLEFCGRMGYKPVFFDARDGNDKQIYHTNVMMCVADRYVVICLDSIPEDSQRQGVIDVITHTKKEIISITLDQMNRFAGNMLQIENKDGKKLLVMSTQAYEALLPEQIDKLSSFNSIVHSPLTIIEKNGGGSARCMMAEVHLPMKN